MKMTFIIVVFVLIVVGAAVIATSIYGSHRSTAAPRSTVWTSDSVRLAKAMPLFQMIEKSSWTVMIESDRSGGIVPGPSSYSTIGFAKVDQNTIDVLAALGVKSDDGLAIKAVESHLADIGVSPQQCKWKRVDGVGRRIIGTTKFQEGEILIDQDSQVVYFRFIAD